MVMEGQYYHHMSPAPIRKESIVDILLKDGNFEPCGAWVNLKVLILIFGSIRSSRSRILYLSLL